MKQKDIRTSMFTFGAVLLLLLLFGFQNCSPMRPLDGVVDASSLAVRATATPYPSSLPSNTSNGTVSSPVFEGSCTNDNAAEPMAVLGNDAPGTALIPLVNSDGRVAFWNIANGAVARGTVCKILANGWTVQAVGDFNGDLNPDIIWRGPAGEVAVWIMRGSSRVSATMLQSVPLDWQLEGAADFNLDGKTDLVWRDSSGNIKIWLMNGTSSPTVTASFAVPLTSHLLSTAAFNAGRRAELLWQDSSGALSLTKFDASLNPTTTSFPTGIYTGYRVIGFGDFNGDGMTDFLLSRNSDSAMILRYMNGTALLGDSTAYAAANASWSFQYTRDVNGDTTADWLWTITGSTGVYLAYTPVAPTPGGTTSFSTPIQTGYSVFKYPHR